MGLKYVVFRFLSLSSCPGMKKKRHLLSSIVGFSQHNELIFGQPCFYKKIFSKVLNLFENSLKSVSF